MFWYRFGVLPVFVVLITCLSAYARPAASKQRRLDTQLVSAVQKNDLAKVKALLDRSANPNAKNEQGSPVLVVAAHRGYTSVAQALLNKGANVNARRKDSSTALLDAITWGHKDVVKILFIHDADVNAAHQQGILKGRTPLIAAAIFGQVTITKMLLERGANVKASDEMGNTALFWAACKGSTEIAKLLVTRGADVDARNWFGVTPLMQAAFGGHTDTAKYLIAQGADVNARDDETRRLYGKAGFVGDEAAMKRIAESNDLSIRRENGRSVLDWATMSGNPEVATLLKQAGARE